MISLLGKERKLQKGVCKAENQPKRLKLLRTSLLPKACVGGTGESRPRTGVLGRANSISGWKGHPRQEPRNQARTSGLQYRDPDMTKHNSNTLRLSG